MYIKGRIFVVMEQLLIPPPTSLLLSVSLPLILLESKEVCMYVRMSVCSKKKSPLL